MGVVRSNTFDGEAVTPVCNDCGISLCWDISIDEYKEEKVLWDSWKCSDCNPNAVGSRKRFHAAIND